MTGVPLLPTDAVFVSGNTGHHQRRPFSTARIVFTVTAFVYLVGVAISRQDVTHAEAPETLIARSVAGKKSRIRLEYTNLNLYDTCRFELSDKLVNVLYL